MEKSINQDHFLFVLKCKDCDNDHTQPRPPVSVQKTFLKKYSVLSPIIFNHLRSKSVQSFEFELSMSNYDENIFDDIACVIEKIFNFQPYDINKDNSIYLEKLGKELKIAKLIENVEHFKANNNYQMLDQMIEIEENIFLLCNEDENIRFTSLLELKNIMEQKRKIVNNWNTFFTNIFIKCAKARPKKIAILNELIKKLIKDTGEIDRFESFVKGHQTNLSKKRNKIIKYIFNDDVDSIRDEINNGFTYSNLINLSDFDYFNVIEKQKITMFELSAYFGSKKCYKYFLLNYYKNYVSSLVNFPKYAIAGGDDEIIRQCINEKLHFDNCLRVAAVFHMKDHFGFIIDKYAENIGNTISTLILENCIEFHEYQTIKILIENGVDMTHALDIAFQNENYQMVQALCYLTVCNINSGLGVYFEKYWLFFLWRFLFLIFYPLFLCKINSSCMQ